MGLDITTKVANLISPIVTEEGCELVDVDLTTDIGQRILRVYIDRTGGVQLGDCERVSHAIEDVIEVEGIVTGRYVLEVSSPGLNRPLRLRAHFEAITGKTVNITTDEKIDGRRRFKGTLLAVTGGEVDCGLMIRIDNQDLKVPLAAVQKANLVYE